MHKNITKHKNIFFLVSIALILILFSSCSWSFKNTEEYEEYEEYEEESSSSVVLPNNDNQPKREDKTTIYPKEYLGTWHGYGTDSYVSLEKIEITAIDEKTVIVDSIGENGNGNTSTSATYTFISPYVAEGQSGLGEKYTSRIELGTDSNGEPALNWYEVFNHDEKKGSESMCCYRETKRENFQDFILNISEPLCNYVGKTVSDVKKNFGYRRLEFYEGASCLPYYGEGICFLTNINTREAAKDDTVISVTSNSNVEIIDGLNGDMMYNDIILKVGKNNVPEPYEYYSEMDNMNIASTQFTYKGYTIYYEWDDSDYRSTTCSYARISK